MPDKKRYLLIDANFLCHKAKYATGHLSHGNTKTGIMYGVLNQVLKLYEDLEADHVVFCWDSAKSVRKHYFPWYKKKRHDNKTDEEKEADGKAFIQFEELRTQVLPAFGFRNNFMQTGLEGDDIMARLCWSYLADDGHELVVVTADEDLYQMITQTTWCYNPTKKEHMTYDLFKETYNIPPNHWPWVKQMAGCTTDEIPGVEGIGEVYAIKAINRELKENSKKYKSLQTDEARAIMNRNIWLVTLPLMCTERMRVVEDEFNQREFMKTCKKYGFSSFRREPNLSRWEELFNG